MKTHIKNHFQKLISTTLVVMLLSVSSSVLFTAHAAEAEKTAGIQIRELSYEVFNHSEFYDESMENDLLNNIFVDFNVHYSMATGDTYEWFDLIDGKFIGDSGTEFPVIDSSIETCPDNQYCHIITLYVDWGDWESFLADSVDSCITFSVFEEPEYQERAVSKIKLLTLPTSVLSYDFDLDKIYSSDEKYEEWESHEADWGSRNMAGASVLIEYENGDTETLNFGKNYDTNIQGRGAVYYFENSYIEAVVSDLGHFQEEISFYSSEGANNDYESYYIDSITFTANHVVSVPVSVKLNRPTLILGVGENYGLLKTVLPEIANQNVTWTSSDSEVATVDSNGKVVGKKRGTTNITVKTSNGLTDTCLVTIKAAPSSVNLSNTSLKMGVGETFTISETTNSGSYANAANLKWTSSDPSVASVTKVQKTNKAVITAKKAGTTNIKIQTFNGKTAVCTLTVFPAPTSVNLNASTLKMGIGETFTISETTNSGSYANASNLNWTSSNTKVATIKKGSGNKAIISAVGKGTTNITIKTYNGITRTCKLTVYAAPTSVRLSNTSLTLKKGQTYTISESTNSGSYANAANLKWSSTNTKVATVTKGSANKATIKAVGKGTAYIKITLYNGKTAQCKVTVQ